MTKIYFRYSYVYEETLARLAGESFGLKDFNDTQKFCEEFGKHWEKHNDKIFSYYSGLGLTLPDFWIAYPVHGRKGMIPFSDPLTFFIKKDFEDAAATLIHELCHVFLTVSQNMTLSNKLWEEVSKKYPKESFNTVAHLLVNLLAKGGVEHIFGENQANQLLAPERTMDGLKEAWAIIDVLPKVVMEKNPLKAINNL